MIPLKTCIEKTTPEQIQEKFKQEKVMLDHGIIESCMGPRGERVVLAKKKDTLDIIISIIGTLTKGSSKTHFCYEG